MESDSISQHEKRKNEIIDCAASLFFAESYEKTSVQKIINTLGIAKGTFYHYFKSKTDLLDQYTKRESGKILTILDEIVSRKDIGIIEKFNSYFEIAMSWKVQNWDLVLIYIRHSGLSENKIVYETMLENNIKAAYPSIRKMVEEGITEGYFRTDFPDLAAEAIFRFGAAVTDMVRPLILSSKTNREAFDHFLRILDFYQDSIEKLLGTDKGLFRIIDREKLEEVFIESSRGTEVADDKN